MDVVAGVASVTQLAFYSHYAAKYLLRLYSTARDPSYLVKCQQQNILVLLQVIHRLNSDNSSLDSDLLLPVFIRVIDIARTLSNWFEESGVLGIKWTLVKIRSQIDDALKSLKQKSDILCLYLVERNYAILLRLETSLNKETRVIAGPTENMNSNVGRKLLGMKQKVMNSAQSSASESTASQSSAGQSSTDECPLGCECMDEETGKILTPAELQSQPDLEPQPHRDQQPLNLQRQYPSTTQPHNQTPQERQKTRSKFSACGNKLNKSYVAVGNCLQDNRDVDIDYNNNEGEETTYIAFNGNQWRWSPRRKIGGVVTK